MEYRDLGKSGLRVSVVGLGTNNFGRRLDDPKVAAEILHTALELGVNFVDTSDDYGGAHRSEQFIGRATRGLRDQVLIGTKFSPRSSEAADGRERPGDSIERALDASLRALGTDYVDVYQVHSPIAADSVEETLRALDGLVRAGKVRHIGCSNFQAWQACEAVWISNTRKWSAFVSVQPLFSMIDRQAEKELLPFCDEYDIGILPYYPLAGGFLTGKYRRGQPVPEGTRMSLAPNQARRWLTDENFGVLDALEAFSAERDHSVADLAFAWLLFHHQVSSVIAGASRPEQVAANVGSAEWRLTADEKEQVDRILDGGAN